MDFAQILPVIFLMLLGLTLLIYVVLDGYDLGVGMLLPFGHSEHEQDVMVSSIGPFWDANETWLVLGVGILLVAFPQAHGLILTQLYLPVAVMLLGLILRGVSFDFRIKAHADHKVMWNHLFTAGSLITAAAQGWMVGEYVAGFSRDNVWFYPFCLLTALTIPAFYVLLGSGWLIMKTEHRLQADSVKWAKRMMLPMVIGLLAISAITPLVSHEIASKWFAFPNVLWLLPIPLLSVAALVVLWRTLRNQKVTRELGWRVFAAMVVICLCACLGLGYSLFPYIVMGKVTVWDAGSGTGSLIILLVGVGITLPMILGYTIWVYRVFWGKASLIHK
ncbi:cytochrome bd ubiquinol oxidase subunit II [Formosimonas limnophila]|uniref:Cytochrome bd ubiquinol oxidase subunit II n=1 Tax=Formosimonas limnophila TaxID=1384487 RepID=A0A8J3CFA9_9BURK|nr:cytochrome d ubiquinol oxidase subunit II [Formosimonas limnophila]GHA64947.1 cytochrome bd ubiquinol oxidase subunit II [Formosimonas limnophila]